MVEEPVWKRVGTRSSVADQPYPTEKADMNAPKATCESIGVYDYYEWHKSSWQYWRWHKLDFDQPIEDGFTDPGRKASDYHGPSRSTGRETLLIDVRLDSVLKEFIRSAGEKLAKCKPGPPAVITLSLLVADALKLRMSPGSAVVPENMCGETKVRIPLGEFIQCKEGVCRHRSFLFKVCAERLNIAQVCVVRGKHEDQEGDGEGNHAWNYVKLPGHGTYLLDLTREPGVLHETKLAEYQPLGLSPKMSDKKKMYPRHAEVRDLFFDIL